MERWGKGKWITAPLGVCLLATGLLRAVGERVSLHQDWLQAVSDSRGGGEHAILFAGIRFTLAGILVIAIASLGRRRPLVPKKGSWGIILKLAACQTVAAIPVLLYWAGKCFRREVFHYRGGQRIYQHSGGQSGVPPGAFYGAENPGLPGGICRGGAGELDEGTAWGPG